MKRRLIDLLLAAGLTLLTLQLSPALAADTALVPLFQKYCVATRVNAKAAQAAARADGFVAAPKGAKAPTNPDLKNVVHLVRGPEGKGEVLVTGYVRKWFGPIPITSHMCVIGSATPSAATASDFERLIGVPGGSKLKGNTLQQTPDGKLRPMIEPKTDAEAKQALTGGKIRLATMSTGAQMTLLALATAGL